VCVCVCLFAGRAGDWQWHWIHGQWRTDDDPADQLDQQTMKHICTQKRTHCDSQAYHPTHATQCPWHSSWRNNYWRRRRTKITQASTLRRCQNASKLLRCVRCSRCGCCVRSVVRYKPILTDSNTDIQWYTDRQTRRDAETLWHIHTSALDIVSGVMAGGYG